jgi:hypothetical protein
VSEGQDMIYIFYIENTNKNDNIVLVIRSFRQLHIGDINREDW